MYLYDFLKDTTNKFGMNIKNGDDLVWCLVGYEEFATVCAARIEDVLVQCIEDCKRQGKPFDNIDALIDYICNEYI